MEKIDHLNAKLLQAQSVFKKACYEYSEELGYGRMLTEKTKYTFIKSQENLDKALSEWVAESKKLTKQGVKTWEKATTKC